MIETTRIDSELANFDAARVPTKSSERVSGNIPYLGASGEVDRVEGFTHDGDYLCVSEDGENLRSRNTPIAWVQRGKFWANNHVHVIGGVGFERLKFFEAALAVVPISSYITGSAQPKLSQAALNSVRIPKFPSAYQAAIGELLGALDGRVVASRDVAFRARELSVAIIGSAPTSMKVGEVARVVRRSVNPSSLGTGSVRHFSLPAFDAGAAVIDAASDIKSAKNLLQEPVVLVSKLNPRIPRIWAVDRLPSEPALASTEFVALAPQGVGIAPLWATLLDPRFTRSLLERTAGTTGSHQRVKPEEILDVDVPDVRALAPEKKDLLESLCRKVNDVADEIERIAATRDELLPLLMSGKITVKDAEKTVEEVV